jgi:3-isopropylmalate/(R)-2-methylmalate dehydratase large subunit
MGAEPGVLARTLSTGLLSTKVPPVAEVLFEGDSRGSFTAFDMGLLAGQALASLSVEHVVEFRGTVVESLPMAGRITLVDLGAEAFRAGIVSADQVTAGFLAERMEAPLEARRPSGDQGYTKSFKVSLSGQAALIQGPGPGGPIRPVSELEGKKIHSAFIGSCAAGRHVDLMAVAGVLKRGKKIHPDVRLVLAPATLEVALKCLNSGIYETFFQVGAMLAMPGASPGMGGGGALFGEGEVILSTTPYKSPMTDAGRGPEVYRASPITIAASAVAGEIRDPANI